MDYVLKDKPSARDRVDDEDVTPKNLAAKPRGPGEARQSVDAREPGYAIHLSIEGLSGECADTHHEEWIVALAYRQSLHRPTTENEQLQPTFEIEKNLDRASPALYYAVNIGRVFNKVIIEVSRDTERSERFFRIELSRAVITEVRQNASASNGSPRPVETLIFGYERIQWTYTKLRQSDAQREGHSSSSWSRAKAGAKVKTASLSK